MTSQVPRTCSVDGCERAYRARGFCATHWSRWRRGMSLDTPVRASNPPDCIHAGCPKKPVARGLCTNHWFSRGRCSFPECDRTLYGNGLCRAHWKREYRQLSHVRSAERAYADRVRDRTNAQARRRRRCEEHREYARKIARDYRSSGRMDIEKKSSQDRAYRRRNASAKSENDRRWRESRKSIPVRRVGSWSPDEDATALRDDITITEIAYILGRSYEAVHGRRRRLQRKAKEVSA